MVTFVKGAVKPTKKVHGRRYGPGRPTLEDLEQRKTRILDVAMSLFVERGYAETSLVDVAKLSGVATRTIYQHYGDKADVFRAVIDKRVSAIEHELPMIDAHEKLFDVLLTTAHYVCVMAFADSAIPFQRLMIAESNRFPDLMRQIFESLYHRLHSNVITSFEMLERAGQIPPGNHAQTAKFFIDLLLGTAPMQLTLRWIRSGPSENELREKVSMFIRGRFGLDVNEPATVRRAANRGVSAMKSKPRASSKR